MPKTKTPKIKIYNISDSRHEKLGHQFIKTSLTKKATLGFLHNSFKCVDKNHLGKLMASINAFDTIEEISEDEAIKHVTEHNGRHTPKIEDFYSQNKEYFENRNMFYIGQRISDILDKKVYADFKLFHEDLPESLEEFKIDMMVKTTIG